MLDWISSQTFYPRPALYPALKVWLHEQVHLSAEQASRVRLLTLIPEMCSHKWWTRAGRKSLKRSTNAWSDVEQAFVFWAERLHQILRELRTGK